MNHPGKQYRKERRLCWPVLLLLALGCAVAPSRSPVREPANDIEQLLASIPYLSDSALNEAMDRIQGRGEEVIPVLEASLTFSHSRVRLVCARLLGRMNAADSLPALMELWQDPDSRVRCEAAIARLALGDVCAVPLLIPLLRSSDRDVRFRTFETLHRVTGLSFGYDFAASRELRSKAAARWEEWAGITAPPDTAPERPGAGIN